MIKIPENFVDKAFLREKDHYQDPIYSREALLELIRHHGKKATLEDFAGFYQVAEKQKALEYRLKAMIRDGQLIDYKGAMTTVDYWPLVKGTVIMHDRQLCAVLDDEEGFYSILKAAEGALFSGDYIEFAKIEPLGAVAFFKLLEPSTVYLQGQIENAREYDLPYGYTIAMRVLEGPFCDQIVSVKAVAKKTYPVGMKILAQLDRTTQSEYVLAEIVDFQETPKGILDIILKMDLPWVWPDQVMKEAAVLSQSEIILSADRENLTHLPFVTIDGVTSKDFDDAVYVEKGNGDVAWVLFVAVADVSHYVKMGTAIDKQAIARGVSVYFPRYVIPMLPEVLSNELCSLKPDEFRYALTCRIELNAQGRRMQYDFLPSVIRSHARLTYDQVERKDVPVTLKRNINELWEVYRLLKNSRKERGSIHFMQQAIHFDLIDGEKVIGITREVSLESHHLIEEMMLAANECAAVFLKDYGALGVYRVHGTPPDAKVQLFNALLKPLGKELVPPYSLEKLAELSHFLANQHPRLAPMLSRIMQRAGYQIEPDRHFGLNFDLYTHFTSPIRRYPDLIVHRLIYDALAYRKGTKRNMSLWGKIPSILSRVNYLERRAEESERNYHQYLKAKFAQHLVSKKFTAHITGLSEFGVFIEIDEYPIDGMIHVSLLGSGFWVYHPAEGYVSNGQHSYRIGDIVTAVLTDVDMQYLRINFSLVG